MADFDVIVEQLGNECRCLKDINRDSDLFAYVVKDMINLVSQLTCWQQNPCETFLLEEREEFFDIGDYEQCGCNAGIVEIEPFYSPIEPGSMKITLLELNGTEVREIDLPDSAFFYNVAWGNTVKINIKEYIRNGECCCPLQYKLRATYYAGYSDIPDCLLPLFCGLLHVVYDKNNCECSTCAACASTEDVVVTAEYNGGDNISKLIDNYYTNIVLVAFKKQLGLISLCRARLENQVWGVTVN